MFRKFGGWSILVSVIAAIVGMFYYVKYVAKDQMKDPGGYLVRWVELCIGIGIGVYLMFLSARKLNKAPGEDAKFDSYMDRFGRLFFFGGIFVIVFELWTFMSRIQWS